MEETFMIVNFNKYCPKCKYYNLQEKHEPCNTCLEHGVNSNSEKPFNFTESKGDD